MPGGWPLGPNLQDRKFIVVKDMELRQRLSEAAMGQPYVALWPVLLPLDVAIAVDDMSLAAMAEGLGTCWIGAFYEDKVKEISGIPEKIRMIVMLTLGYPSESPAARPRKKLEEIVAYDGWRS